MRRIKLIVAYDGTEYSGWQIQPEAPTIEMYLDKAIRELKTNTIMKKYAINILVILFLLTPFTLFANGCHANNDI